MSTRGYVAIGIYGGKTASNVGTLWRSAHLYEAALIFTVGARYRHQSSDTPHTPLHTPLMHFRDVDDLIEHLPDSATLIGVELDPRGTPLGEYCHPQRAVYLLGAEDRGLPQSVLDRCHDLIQIESARPQSMNVAVAGSILLHHRHAKGARQLTSGRAPATTPLTGDMQ